MRAPSLPHPSPLVTSSSSLRYDLL
jgi:hypothetical protein